MSNYNTGNPVPSTDPRDLDDNATVFDLLLQSPDPSVPDRLGVQRKTWAQMEDDAAALVAPNVSALAALTPAVDRAFYFNTVTPVGMGVYTLTTFARSLGAAVDAAAFRSTAGAEALNSPEVSIASAANINIGAATATSILITGTTTIDSLGTVTAGVRRKLRFAGALTLTYNAISMILPGSANITTAANDVAQFVSLGGGNWLCDGYTARDGQLLRIVAVAKGGTGATTAAAARTNLGVAFTAWANLPLNNSWVVNTPRRAVYRSFLDMVQLEVQIASGTATDGTTVATLPVGFRPPNTLGVPVAGAPNTALSTTVGVPRVLINTDGTIQCFNCTTAGSIAFSTVFATV